jgi:hypothetical protein
MDDKYALRLNFSTNYLLTSYLELAFPELALADRQSASSD